jgi:hypothetical protein
MAVNALIGWGVGCDPYAKPEDLMYYRAVMEGMPAMDGGERSDPKIFLWQGYVQLSVVLAYQENVQHQGRVFGSQGYPWAVYRVDTLRPLTC